MNINRDDLNSKITEYLLSLDNTEKTEWYCTDREINLDCFDEFVNWLYGEEDAKEKRRQQYEELRKEFDN